MFDGLLNHRLRVLRLAGELDRFGQPKSTYAPAGEYACRMTAASGRERFAERSREVYDVTHTVYVRDTADVNEQDRVEVYDPRTGVTILADGNVVLLRRVYGLGGAHHLELKVNVVRNPVDGDGGQLTPAETP